MVDWNETGWTEADVRQARYAAEDFNKLEGLRNFEELIDFSEDHFEVEPAVHEYFIPGTERFEKAFKYLLDESYSFASVCEQMGKLTRHDVVRITVNCCHPEIKDVTDKAFDEALSEATRLYLEYNEDLLQLHTKVLSDGILQQEPCNA